MSRSIPQRVIMVTNNALEDKIGGHERYVRELASSLSRRGVEVSIVCKQRDRSSPPREVRPDGVVLERHRVPSKRNPLYAGLFPLYVASGVRARTRSSRKRTVIHAHMGLPAVPLALGGSPYMFTFHAPVWRELLDERQGSYSLPPAVQGAAVGSLRRAEGLVAKRAGATVVLSEFMRGELKLLDAGAAERATVVPGGIDTTRFFPARDAPDGRPEPGSPPLLFTARRLIPRTGVDELIRAMPIVLDAQPDAKLIIAGTGGLEPELRALAQRLGVAERVELLGRISDDELVRSYRRATLVVMPTRALEGFGLTTAEALACGAVVVGTPAGATPELLAPIDPGLVTDDQSAASIAAAVVELLGQPDRLHQLRARVVDRVVPAMGWDRVADRYLALYEQLIA